MQLEVLCTTKMDDEVQRRLGRLPPKLSQLYSEIYDNMLAPRIGIGRSIVLNTFKWLLCSKQSMESSTFLDALTSSSTTLDESITKEGLLDFCCNFVVFDSQLDVFRLAHLSVREFLEKLPDFQLPTCHALAAETCLISLIRRSKTSAGAQLFLDLSKKHLIRDKPSSLPETPTMLKSYASEHWGQHCSEANGERLEGALCKLLWFFLLEESEELSGTMTREHSSLALWLRDWTRLRERELQAIFGEYYSSRVRCFVVACRYGLHEIVSKYLGQPEISLKVERSGLLFAAREAYLDVLELLLDWNDKLEMTEFSIIELARAGHKGSKALAFLVDRSGRLNVSEHVIREVGKLRPWYDAQVTRESMSLLLGQAGSVDVSRILQDTEFGWSPAHLKAILNYDKTFKVTTSLFERAVSRGTGTELLQLLHDRSDALEITDRVMKNAARNILIRKEGLSWLLDHGGQINEAIMLEAASYGTGRCLEWLCDRGGEVTDKVVEAVWNGQDHYYKSRRILVMLERGMNLNLNLNGALQRMESWISSSRTDHLMQFLLDHDADFAIEEAMLIEAIQQDWCDLEMMHLLLDRCKQGFEPESVLAAAAMNWRYGLELVRSLLGKYTIEVTPALMVQVAGDRSDGGDAVKLMPLLLDQCSTIEITEDILISAAGNWNVGLEMMQLLLARCSLFTITEDVLISAAENDILGLEMMQSLLARRSDFTITEAILISAAGNWNVGPEMMQLLLARCNDLTITERIMLSMAKNRFQGTGLMELVFDQYPTIEITEAIANAMAQYGTRIGLLQLFNHDRTLQVSETMLKSALSNQEPNYRFENFSLLLDRSGSSHVADEICELIAADRNQEMFDWLCRRIDLNSNLLAKCQSISRLFTAVRTRQSGLVEELILDGVKVDPSDGLGQTPLSIAAEEGDTVSVHMLLSTGANPNVADRQGETSLHKAAEEGDTVSVHMLLSTGANPNVTDRQGETSLHKAAGTGHYDTVRVLLDHGAVASVENMRKRTPLSWAKFFDYDNIAKLLQRYMPGGDLAPR